MAPRHQILRADPAHLDFWRRRTLPPKDGLAAFVYGNAGNVLCCDACSFSTKILRKDKLDPTVGLLNALDTLQQEPGASVRDDHCKGLVSTQCEGQWSACGLRGEAQPNTCASKGTMLPSLSMPSTFAGCSRSSS